MATDSGLRDNDYPRVCDICGHRFWFSELTPIGELKFACPDDAPGLTALQISRYNARVRPVVVRPNKWAKDYIQTPIYQLAEAEIFNLVARVAPAAVRDGASDSLAAAWATIYMADVVIQNKRPANWNRTALTTITRCLTHLLTMQCGSGLLPATPITDTRYGGVTSGGTLIGSEFSTATWSTAITIAACVAFAKAYSATEATAYLDAAKKCATFLRHVQCGDKQVTGYHVYPSGGGRYHSGGLASGVTDANGVLLTSYLTADIVGLWAMKALSDIVGSSTVYGDAASTGYMAQATNASLATMMSELTTFATTGPRDSTKNGALTPGLSTTAPRAQYTAATNGGTGTAAWATSATIPSDDIAMAVIGLYMANGQAAIVTDMMAWLTSFSSNEDNHTPATMPESQALAGITGTYDPTMCPADVLVAGAPFTESSGALYAWSTLGLLSPILSASDLAAFKRSKDQLSVSQRFSALDNHELFLGPIGASGLSFQPIYRGPDGGLVGVPGSGAGGGGSAAVTPPSEGLVLWVKGDAGVLTSGALVTGWQDQGPLGQHLDANNAGNEPTIGTDTLNGVPGIVFPVGITNPVDPTLTKFLGRLSNLKASDGKTFGVGVGEHPARTVFAVVRPRMFNSDTIMVTGGMAFSFRQAGPGSFSCFVGMLWLQAYFDSFRPSFFVYSNEGGPYGLTQVRGPDTLGTVYENQPMLVEWRADYPSLAVAVNGGADLTLTPSTLTGISTDGNGPSNAGFFVGHGSPGSTAPNWQGSIFEMLVWDRVLTGASLTAARSYIAGRYPSVTLAYAHQPAVIRAAKTGMVYRQDPGRYPLHRGN